MSFAEIRFSTNLSRGSGGYSFKNVTSAGASALEGRVGHTSIPLFTGDIGSIYVDEVELQYLIAFFNARKGRSQGFRYKYHADYSCTNTREIIDDYSFTQGVTIPAIADGITKIFQMAKLYSNCGERTVKPLYKIVPGTVKVFIDGAEQPNVEVDITTGEIIFASPPAVGVEVDHSCEFDLPVRFDIDELVGIQEILDTRTGEKLYTFSNLPIVEFVPSPPVELGVQCPALLLTPNKPTPENRTLSSRFSAKSVAYAVFGVSTRNRIQVELSTGDPSKYKKICNAFLYWNIHGDYQPSSSLIFNSQNVDGECIGVSSNTCWGEQGNQVFRADITSIIQNDLKESYSIKGLIADGIRNNGQGIAILILYIPQDKTDLCREVRIYDGSYALPSDSSVFQMNINSTVKEVAAVITDCQNYDLVTIYLDNDIVSRGTTGAGDRPEIYIPSAMLSSSRQVENLAIHAGSDCVNVFLIVTGDNDNPVPETTFIFT